MKDARTIAALVAAFALACAAGVALAEDVAPANTRSQTFSASSAPA